MDATKEAPALSMMCVTLLGVPIAALTADAAVWRLVQLLGVEGGKHVMTPNSEMLVEAVRNPLFHSVLERSALNLPDSSGLLFMARCTGQKFPERVTGVDTVERLCRELTEEHPVFLLGGGEGVGARARARLICSNPRLRVVGVYTGTPREEEREEILRHINGAKPHLLLVAFGSPEQDLWIDRVLSRMPSVRVAMGVGGTLDFLAGVQRRAPRALQKIRCEWLWRLWQEPRRFRRIWKAVVVFPWLVVRWGRHAPSSLP